MPGKLNKVNLSHSQELAADALAMGRKIADIANELTVSENTIWRWQQNPLFSARSRLYVAVFNKTTGEKYVVFSEKYNNKKRYKKLKSTINKLETERQNNKGGVCEKSKNKKRYKKLKSTIGKKINKKDFSASDDYSSGYGSSIWTVSGGGGPGTGKKR